MGITGLDMAAAHATTELPKDTKVTIYIKNTIVSFLRQGVRLPLSTTGWESKPHTMT